MYIFLFFSSKLINNIYIGRWEGNDSPDFGQGVVGSQEGSWTGREILSYHLQEVCSKVVTFEEKCKCMWKVKMCPIPPLYPGADIVLVPSGTPPSHSINFLLF